MIVILFIASKWIGFSVPWYMWIVAIFDSVASSHVSQIVKSIRGEK